MPDLESQVSGAFLPLIEAGLLRLESSVVGGSFDQAAVRLGGRNVVVRLTRDRGSVSLDVSSRHSTDEWYPPEWLTDGLTQGELPLARVTTPSDAARLIVNCLPELERLMSPDEYARTANRIHELEPALRVKMLDALHRG